MHDYFCATTVNNVVGFYATAPLTWGLRFFSMQMQQTFLFSFSDADIVK
jgi:hypothetical protein